MNAFKHHYLSESELWLGIRRSSSREIRENSLGSFMLSVYCAFFQVLLSYFHYESATLIVVLQKSSS